MQSFTIAATMLLMSGSSLLFTPVGATPVASSDKPFSTPAFVSQLQAGAETNVTQRDIRGALPNWALWLEHTFVPVFDFDQDGCYFTSAIDPSGNKNPGLSADNGVPPNCLRARCRDNNRLQNNNVYARSRCNNGWCAVMYETYYEKDQMVCGSFGSNEIPMGHRHDWENVVVFSQGDVVKRVAPSCHGKYDKATNSPRLHGGTHPKIVYHKDGAGTHCLRMANAADDSIENFTGQWFFGELIGWSTGWPSTWLRDAILDGWGGPKPKLADWDFGYNLEQAAGGQVPGFDPWNG